MKAFMFDKVSQDVPSFGALPRVIQMISVEPPPMSNTSAPRYLRPISGAQPSAARPASSSAEITFNSSPIPALLGI